MGKFWLHDAVIPLQKALGEDLYLYPGYSTRSRSTGGFDKICGIVMHHDADKASGSDMYAVEYCANRAPDSPIGNFHLVRDGTVVFHSAGASNHAGKGGPVSTSKWTVGKDLGNKYLIGIEASNDGVGEVWPNIQLTNYIILVATLCKTFDLNPMTDVYGHFDWCAPSTPGRKIDPAGPTPKYPKFGGISGRKTWDIVEVRKQIQAVMKVTVPPVVNDWRILGATYPTPGPMKDKDGQDIFKKGLVHSNVPWLQAVLCSMDTKDGKPIYTPEWVGADNINGAAQNQLFGDATFNAFVYWQTMNGLTGDGVLGTVSANKMFEVRGK